MTEGKDIFLSKCLDNKRNLSINRGVSCLGATLVCNCSAVTDFKYSFTDRAAGLPKLKWNPYHLADQLSGNGARLSKIRIDSLVRQTRGAFTRMNIFLSKMGTKTEMSLRVSTSVFPNKKKNDKYPTALRNKGTYGQVRNIKRIRIQIAGTKYFLLRFLQENITVS